jgi:hypothetical protein
MHRRSIFDRLTMSFLRSQRIQDIGRPALPAFLLSLEGGAACQAGGLALRTWSCVIASDLASAAGIAGLFEHVCFWCLIFAVMMRGVDLGNGEKSGRSRAKAGVGLA